MTRIGDKRPYNGQWAPPSNQNTGMKIQCDIIVVLPEFAVSNPISVLYYLWWNRACMEWTHPINSLKVRICFPSPLLSSPLLPSPPLPWSQAWSDAEMVAVKVGHETESAVVAWVNYPVDISTSAISVCAKYRIKPSWEELHEGFNLL